MRIELDGGKRRREVSSPLFTFVVSEGEKVFRGSRDYRLTPMSNRREGSIFLRSDIVKRKNALQWCLIIVTCMFFVLFVSGYSSE